MVVTIALGIVLAVIILELLPVVLGFVGDTLTAAFTPLGDALRNAKKSKRYKKFVKFIKTNQYASYIYPVIIILMLAIWAPWWCVLLLLLLYALSVLIYEFVRILF